MFGGSKDEVELMKKRSAAFLDVAKYSLRPGSYDVAAFGAGQAAQLHLKSTLLELIGDFPRTHSIISLLGELRRVNEKEVDAFVQKHKRGFHNLEDAYLVSRYFYKIFDREEWGIPDLIG